MATARISKEMRERIHRTTSWLRDNPWSTRSEIADAMGFDMTQMKRVFEYLSLR